MARRVLKGAWIACCWVALGVGLCACRSAPPPEFPTWSTLKLDATVGSDHPMLQASRMILAQDREILSQPSFTPDQRAKAMKAWSPAVAKVLGASDASLEEPIPVHATLSAEDDLVAWRAIGRSLIWQLEDALEQDDVSGVQSSSRGIVRFSRALLSGSATHVDLGLTLLDEHRERVLSALEKFEPTFLRSLATTLATLEQPLATMPQLTKHEKERMLASVQWLQDSYRAEKWDGVRERLGRESIPAIDYLRGLRGKDGPARAEFFKGLGDEVEFELKTIEEALKTPAARRSELPIPSGDRPWKRFAKHFFRTMRPVLAKRDLTQSRTQMLVLRCRLLAQTKEAAAAPRMLPPGTGIDPFTGLPFGYAASGRTFRIYSLGRDRLDNGGKTDLLFESPDLTLESGPGF